jgi:hypothetical protein
MITARPITRFLHWMFCNKNMACLSLLHQEFNILCLFHSLFNDEKILVREYTVKIKFAVVPIMKAWVSGGIPPRILNLDTRCRWVVRLVLRQLQLQERTPGAHSRGRWVGTTDILRDLERWYTLAAAGSRFTISRSFNPWPGHCTHLAKPSNKHTAELVNCIVVRVTLEFVSC